MARQCEICAKGTIAGRHIQHHHSIGWRYKAPRKVRQFKPNLRKVAVYDDEGNKTKIKLCMKCYKRARKDYPEMLVDYAEIAERKAEAKKEESTDE